MLNTLTFIALFYLPFILLGQESLKRNIDKEYKVHSDYQFTIRNKFGSVFITTWDKAEIKVKVEITLKGQACRDLFEQIKIVENLNSNSIELVTRIPHQKRQKRYNTSGKNMQIAVDYIVQCPKYLFLLEIHNKFGSTHIGNFDGRLVCHMGFGNLQLGSLSHSENEIYAKFSSVQIDKINSGTIQAKYNRDFVIKEAENIDVNFGHGTLNITSVEKANLAIKYSKLYVDHMLKSCTADSKFSTLNIDHVSPNFEKIKIISKYGTTKISFDKDAAFDFDVNTKYGSFNCDVQDSEILKRFVEKTHSKYSGMRQKKNRSKGKVSVHSAFGDVIFKD